MTALIEFKKPTTDTLVAEYARLQEEIAPALQRMQEIEETFRDLDPGTYETDHGDVEVRSYRRFNERDALELMSEQSKKRVMRLKVDSKEIKRQFPGIYRKAQRQHDNRVSISTFA